MIPSAPPGSKSPGLQVNWFSPLPRDRTGIADFTAALAPLLRQRAATRFIAQPNAFSAEAFDGGETLDRIGPRDINRAQINVFNIGNNAVFHDEIWRLSVVSAGIVILHDARLQHLFGGTFLYKHRDPQGYVDLMRETYGIEGEAAANVMAAGRASTEAIAELFPLVEAGVRGAAGAIVHSGAALRLVRERTSVPVIKLNLPYDAGDAPPPKPAKRPGDRQAGRFDIVLFGYLGPNRRIESVLRALAGAGDRREFRLHLIGHIWNERLIRQQAQELGIGESVTVHDYVPDPVLEEHLQRADLVVNLRGPTMGEASYTQLRAFRHAAPTMVTRVGWYAELPEDSVIHISPDREVEEIGQVLVRLRSDREALLAIGERGRELLVRDFTPREYVEKTLAFGARNARSLRPLEQRLASRIAAELLPFPPESAGLVLDAVARKWGRGRSRADPPPDTVSAEVHPQ